MQAMFLGDRNLIQELSYVCMTLDHGNTKNIIATRFTTETLTQFCISFHLIVHVSMTCCVPIYVSVPATEASESSRISSHWSISNIVNHSRYDWLYWGNILVFDPLLDRWGPAPGTAFYNSSSDKASLKKKGRLYLHNLNLHHKFFFSRFHMNDTFLYFQKENKH